MTTKDEALKQALAALEFSKSYLDELADVHGTAKKAKPGSTSWIVNRAIIACREALAQKDEQEPNEVVYAFRRKGLDDFCTCDERRYKELSEKPNLFETTVFYTTPPKLGRQRYTKPAPPSPKQREKTHDKR